VLDQKDEGFEQHNEIHDACQGINIGDQGPGLVDPELHNDQHGNNTGQQFEAQGDHKHVKGVNHKFSELPGKKEAGYQVVVEK
jgi:hypothetical protein